jgi:hypothetical protein
VKEFRVYYNESGEVVMYSETDHPPGTNYVVIDNPDVFFKTNTSKLRVIDNQLKVVDIRPERTRLTKSQSGQAVVRGMAAMALEPNEQYADTEYYDRTTNN